MAWSPPTNPAPNPGDPYTYQSIVYQWDGKRWVPKGPDLSTMLPATIHAATLKSTPVDADEMELVDSATSFSLKRITWAGIKAALLAYFKGQFREKISATRTYYVATTGNESNDGLSSGSPFLTIQKAVDTAAALDNGNFDITISVAAGTYNTGAVLKESVGGGKIIISGAASDLTSTVISVTSGTCFVSPNATRSSKYRLQWLKMQTTTAGYCLAVYGGPNYVEIGNVNFGPSASSHIFVGTGSVVNATGATYTISGGAPYHVEAGDGGYFLAPFCTINITGTPAFGAAFVTASRISEIQIYSSTFNGSATGTKYIVALNAVIFVNGGGANYLPGSAAGNIATGGQYA